MNVATDTQGAFESQVQKQTRLFATACLCVVGARGLALVAHAGTVGRRHGGGQITGLVSTTRSSIHTSSGPFIGWKLHAPTKSWVIEGPYQGEVTNVGATQALP